MAQGRTTYSQLGTYVKKAGNIALQAANYLMGGDTQCPTADQQNQIGFDRSQYPSSCFDQAMKTHDAVKSTVTPSVTDVPTPTQRPDQKQTVADDPQQQPQQKTTPKQDPPSQVDIPSGNQSGDTQACQQKVSEASQCCLNPMSCLGTAISLGYVNASDAAAAQSYASQAASAATSGIPQDAATLQQASLAAQNVNQGLSALCYARKSACATTCQGFKQAYSTSDLDSAISTCQGLDANVVALGASANQNTQNALEAALPMAAAGVGGQDSGSGISSDPYGCAANPQAQACIQCSQNPSSPACQALAQANAQEQGQGSFAAQKDPSQQGGFNLPDAAASLQNLPSTATPNQAATPPTVQTVANNTGGGVPSAGDSSATAAAAQNLANGPQGQGNSPGSPGYTVDIQQGLRSGGYSAPGGSTNLDASMGSVYPYRAGRTTASNGKTHFDLRQYLPGGSKDGSRWRMIGGLASPSSQINNRFVNLWNRITDKMQEKCRLGELLDCG